MDHWAKVKVLFNGCVLVFHCLFWLVNVTCSPWLMSSSSIYKTSNVSFHTTVSLALLILTSTLKNPCDYNGPIQINQLNLSLSLFEGQLIRILHFPLPCKLIYSQVLGIKIQTPWWVIILYTRELQKNEVKSPYCHWTAWGQGYPCISVENFMLGLCMISRSSAVIP